MLYVQNITDVDDPLLERAAATGEDWEALAAREIARFVDDMTELRLLAPDEWVSVVESIPHVVRAIEKLLATGAAYEVDGDLYFDITADPRFGSVANLSAADMLRLSAERGGDPDRAGKRHPLDALLWRAERPGSRAGRVPSVRDAQAGTSSAWRSHWTTSVRPSTCGAAVATWPSPTTRSGRRRVR